MRSDPRPRRGARAIATGRRRPRPPAPEEAGRRTPEEERALLERHRAGDPEALAELLEGYQRRVFAVCLRMLGDRDVATDLAQESLLKVLRGLDSYDGRSAFSTWVIRITMNACLTHLRRERLRSHASLDEMAGFQGPGGSGAPIVGRIPQGTEPGGAERVEREETAEMLRRALAELDPQARAMLVLRDLQDLEYEQIGQVLGIPLGTVKSRIFRARAALRDRLERMGGGDVDSEDRAGNSGGTSGRTR